MSETMLLSLPVLRPVLYTDTVKGEQVCRDDLWAVSTEELNAIHNELKQYKAAAEEDLLMRGELRQQLYEATLEISRLKEGK